MAAWSLLSRWRNCTALGWFVLSNQYRAVLVPLGPAGLQGC